MSKAVKPGGGCSGRTCSGRLTKDSLVAFTNPNFAINIERSVENCGPMVRMRKKRAASVKRAPNIELRVVLTGFMGVGKTSVARHLAKILRCDRIDLDTYIQDTTGRTIAELIDTEGEARYRQIESASLADVLGQTTARVISLGGGTWTIDRNRAMLKDAGLTSVWLESTFEHCWYNIRKSRKERPLARNKDAAFRLFRARQAVYCLADWHFVVKPEFTSYDVAAQIAEEVFN